MARNRKTAKTARTAKKGPAKKAAPKAAKSAKKPVAKKLAPRRAPAKPAKLQKTAPKAKAPPVTKAKAPPVTKAKAPVAKAKAPPVTKAKAPVTKAKAPPAAKAMAAVPAAAKAPASKAPYLGHFCWHDLMSTDVDGSLAFHRKVFGWTSTAHDMGPMGIYNMFTANGTDFGGVMPFDKSHGAPSHWMPYVAVADVGAVCAKAGKLGGVVCVPPTPIPDVGTFAVVADPLGGTFCPIQLASAPMRDPLAQPTVGMVAWNELVTADPAKAGAFYAKLFGWKVTDMEMGTMGKYHVFKLGDRDVAGMMKTPPEVPPEARPTWLAYFMVTDVDATTAKAQEAGALVQMPPFDVPTVGRCAIIQDPSCAVFGLWSPDKK